jgi:exosortase/archaeosortase family protein
MKQFVALYFLFIALLFTLFYVETSMFSVMLNEGQTKLTLLLLDLFLKPEQLKGIDIWINPSYKIVITQACNGMIPILFFFASALAYPSSITHKVVWMVFGYVLFSVVNVLRILLVVFVTESGKGQQDFYWSHDLLGNTLLLMTGLGLFVTFIKTSSKTVKNIGA